MRSGGEILVECLINLGANKGFGVPGESYLAVLDAFYDVKDKFDFITCRNEGGAAFMAAALGKLTGTPGICFVTRGPGVTNASIGVHTAMQDSAPMILFVGQVATTMKGREAFQEIDYKAVFGTMAKWAVEIDDVNRLPEILMRAWVTATTGRPGPVVIALPEDMLSAKSTAEPLQIAPYIAPAAPDEKAVTAALETLAHAKKPLIIFGGANWQDDGKAALQSFAESSDIPVVSVFRYKDHFDNFSPAYVGEAGVGMAPHVRNLIKDADVILAVNIRFGENSTDGYSLLNVPIPKQKIIHVHSSDREIGKIYQPVIGIHSGPNSFAKALSPVHGNWQAWRQKARADFEAAFHAPAQPSPVDMVLVCAWLQDNLPENVIVTNGAGNFTIWPNKFLKFGPEARLLAPQSGAMGYGVPAAIAAKFEHPDRLVLCFAGDGDFQMTLQELATARQADACPIILVLNNGTYGTIRAHQERTYPARVSGTDMFSPDFVALAHSYGFHAERVEKTEDFANAFARARNSKTGAVLELNVSAEAITPTQTLSQMRETALAMQSASGGKKTGQQK